MARRHFEQQGRKNRDQKAQNEQEAFYEQRKPTIRYDKPIPITDNHRHYHNLCKNPEKKIVLADGWAGTGKTIVAAYYAAQALRKNSIKSIVVMRSLEGVGKDPGAYPGNSYEKNEPKLKQLLNYISAFTGTDVQSLMANEQLKVCGLYDVQGQDLTGSWLVVTECQTLTAEQMYQLCTRGAEKLILEGDTCPAQLTNRKVKVGEDGLSFLLDTIGDLDIVGRVNMGETEDIVRQDYMKKIIMRMMPALEALRNK